MTNKEIGARIARARLDLGWTQSELARRMRCSRASISQWEGGSRAVPVTELARLAVRMSRFNS